MLRILLCAAALAAVCGSHVSIAADESSPANKRPCCPPQCPNCKAYCKFEMVDGKEEKSCWCVERKAICIPRITFPWQKCCEPKCGRVKWVKVLKEMTYECDRCQCKWTVVEEPCPACCDETGGSHESPPGEDREAVVRRLPRLLK